MSVFESVYQESRDFLVRVLRLASESRLSDIYPAEFGTLDEAHEFIVRCSDLAATISSIKGRHE